MKMRFDLHTPLVSILGALALLSSGCGNEGGEGGSAEGGAGTTLTSAGTASATAGSSATDDGSASAEGSVGDGDGDESAGDGDGSAGDGDGNGDGDGDASVGDGDGDGDGSAGDGDGDGSAGDGDGDGSAGDGDGDGSAGDGDGDGDGSAGDGDGDGSSVSCQTVEHQPTSVGCSFIANRSLNLNSSGEDALVVGNPSANTVANVTLYQDTAGGEIVIAGPIAVDPSGTHVFALNHPMMSKESQIRTDGAFRVGSDHPIVAYQHSPIGAAAHNDASMLLPEHAQRRNHVIASYVPTQTSVDHRAYFNVIALEDNTTVQWTSPIATPGSGTVPALNAGEMGTVTLDRMDTLQVVTPNDDFDPTGAQITADKAIWVLGASMCSVVPENSYACDHLQEQMLPLEYWGSNYVAAHAPERDTEQYYWRIFSGADNTTITATPAQAGSPWTLDRGEWVEVVADDSFILSADGPFLPVQYLASFQAGANIGDPAMVQAVPVEQFLSRYVFVTGEGYSVNPGGVHYVQVIRPSGGPDVLVDGATVGGYATVGSWEVADWEISEGAHVAESAGAFGVIQVGYTEVTSYAYPGGMGLTVINPQ